MTTAELEALSFVFPNEPFQFRMNIRRGDFDDFFAPGDPTVLAERAHWLKIAAAYYSAYLPEAALLVEEFADRLNVPAQGSSAEDWRALGAVIAPDVILLNGNEPFKVVAGNVCFPSSWSLADKIGKPLTTVHSPAPTLNDGLGSQIGTFLGKLKPDVAWERWNWGLTASPELNQHPSRPLPRITAEVDPGTVFIRLERQLLLCLPRTGGILFGISIQHIPLPVVKNTSVGVGLKLALETMPPDIAAYKGLAEGRGRLQQFLAG